MPEVVWAAGGGDRGGVRLDFRDWEEIKAEAEALRQSPLHQALREDWKEAAAGLVSDTERLLEQFAQEETNAARSQERAAEREVERLLSGAGLNDQLKEWKAKNQAAKDARAALKDSIQTLQDLSREYMKTVEDVEKGKTDPNKAVAQQRAIKKKKADVEDEQRRYDALLIEAERLASPDGRIQCSARAARWCIETQCDNICPEDRDDCECSLVDMFGNEWNSELQDAVRDKDEARQQQEQQEAERQRKKGQGGKGKGPAAPEGVAAEGAPAAKGPDGGGSTPPEREQPPPPEKPDVGVGPAREDKRRPPRGYMSPPDGPPDAHYTWVLAQVAPPDPCRDCEAALARIRANPGMSESDQIECLWGAAGNVLDAQGRPATRDLSRDPKTDEERKTLLDTLKFICSSATGTVPPPVETPPAGRRDEDEPGDGRMQIEICHRRETIERVRRLFATRPGVTVNFDSNTVVFDSMSEFETAVRFLGDMNLLPKMDAAEDSSSCLAIQGPRGTKGLRTRTTRALGTVLGVTVLYDPEAPLRYPTERRVTISAPSQRPVRESVIREYVRCRRIYAWIKDLPQCPPTKTGENGIEAQLGKVLKNGHRWCRDTLADLHQPADCYRSAPAARGGSGQQCCYDQQTGKLITRDYRAGTPDRVSMATGVLPNGDCDNADEASGIWWEHLLRDVAGWDPEDPGRYFRDEHPPSRSDFERYIREVAERTRAPFDEYGLNMSATGKMR